MLGVSLASHHAWRLAKPELCISVRGSDLSWPLAVGHIAETQRGTNPFRTRMPVYCPAAMQEHDTVIEERRALGGQPRLLDDPRDNTERRLELFWRGIPPDRDDDREAIPERLADHRRDSKSQAWRPLVRKVHLKLHRPHLLGRTQTARPGQRITGPAPASRIRPHLLAQ
jgi:hypothetical protein